jgi:hypothetical protein
MTWGMGFRTRRSPLAHGVSAASNWNFSARSSRLLTEEGAQRAPPRGVRSYMASSCAPICASVRSGLARLIPATSVTRRSLLIFQLAA